MQRRSLNLQPQKLTLNSHYVDVEVKKKQQLKM